MSALAGDATGAWRKRSQVRRRDADALLPAALDAVCPAAVGAASFKWRRNDQAAVHLNAGNVLGVRRQDRQQSHRTGDHARMDHI